MIASLPMYLFPETRSAHDEFWAAIRDRLRDFGIGAPERLNQDIELEEAWGAPDLVLGHICNLPWRAKFRDAVTVIGASDYGLEGCGPGEYRAVFVVRDDHEAESKRALDGARMAFSDAMSHSGWGAAATWALSEGIAIHPAMRTGSHVKSIDAVVSGMVDFATIDAQTFRILKRSMPKTAQLRVIGSTDPSPGITFITRGGEDPAPYREALLGALSSLNQGIRDQLGLRDVVPLPETAYDLPMPPTPSDIHALMRG